MARRDIDYLKYDWCNTEGLAARGAYMTMAAALIHRTDGVLRRFVIPCRERR